MKFTSAKYSTCLLVASLVATGAWAQDAEKADKTGTNPINFSTDFRIYNEYQWLNTEGDGSQNITTFEYRNSLFEGKYQWRIKLPFTSLKADLDDDGDDDVDESGVGDASMRLLTILDLNKENKTAWAAGLELFLDTADEDVLGAGSTSLGPQIFFVQFLETGLFAPALQYKFSVDEDDGRSEVDQFLIDLNYLKMAKDKKSWFFADPQLVFDNENDQEFGIVDLEFGWMMATWYEDLQGHSFYLRPSFGFGADRPTEGSLEFGYKIVGF